MPVECPLGVDSAGSGIMFFCPPRSLPFDQFRFFRAGEPLVGIDDPTQLATDGVRSIWRIKPIVTVGMAGEQFDRAKPPQLLLDCGKSHVGISH